MVVLLEKLSMSLDKPQQVKLVNKIIPHITGSDGSVINIRLGSQMNETDQILWAPEQTFIVGTDTELSTIVKGKYISIRFRSDDVTAFFKIHGFKLDISEAGRY